MTTLSVKVQRGLSLIELLIGISVIAVLAALALTLFSNVRTKAVRTHSLSDLRQCGMALQLYSKDNHGEMVLVSYAPGYPGFTWAGILHNSGFLDDPSIAVSPLYESKNFDAGIYTYGAVGSIDHPMDPYTHDNGTGQLVRILRHTMIEEPSNYILLADSIRGVPGSPVSHFEPRFIARGRSAGDSGYFHLAGGRTGNIFMADGSCHAVTAEEYVKLRRDMWGLTWVGQDRAKSEPMVVFDQSGRPVNVP